MVNMIKSLLFVFTFLFCVYDIKTQNACSSPLGQQGRCISIYQCASLLELLNKKPRTSEDTELLRRSQCGFEGQRIPKVCCTDIACRGPNQESGVCIDISKCSSVLALSRPIPQFYIDYLRRSTCNGATSHSICCTPTLPANNEASGESSSGECRISSLLPDPKQGCCGKDNNADRIVGGEATSIDQYPWLALIEYKSNNKIKLLCGAALISQRYVLTAGHCVKGSVLKFGTPANVRLGEYDTSTEEDCVPANGGGSDCADPMVIIPIDQTIPHPEYNPQNKLRRNDIALIRMKKLAPYTDFIRPICLPTTNTITTLTTDVQLFAAGWGSTESKSFSTVKLHIGLPYQPLEQCQRAYRQPSTNIELWHKHICAGGQKGKDSCKGDSGGPLMYTNKETTELIGIVSFGPDPCGLEGTPGVYTYVYEYLNWIKQNIRN